MPPTVPMFRPTVMPGRGAADVERMEALMLGVLLLWALVAAALAVVLGRGIGLADVRSRAERRLGAAACPGDAPSKLSSSRR